MYAAYPWGNAWQQGIVEDTSSNPTLISYHPPRRSISVSPFVQERHEDRCRQINNKKLLKTWCQIYIVSQASIRNYILLPTYSGCGTPESKIFTGPLIEYNYLATTYPWDDHRATFNCLQDPALSRSQHMPAWLWQLQLPFVEALARILWSTSSLFNSYVRPRSACRV